MSQYLLFDDLLLRAPVSEATSSRAEDPTGKRSGEHCFNAAAQMQKHVDAKHRSADNLLLQPPTRRRLAQSDVLRREAHHLEQIQQTLRRLAELHQDGTIPPDLANLTSRAAIERALSQKGGPSALHEIYRQAACDDAVDHQVVRMEREASLKGIPGFVPTPSEIAHGLVEFALIKSNNTLLEPSAGSGSLIDAVLKDHSDTQVSYCELNCYLLDILRLKYQHRKNVHFITRDFEELDPRQSQTRFDRIILNPPFERGQDVEHVLRAYELLAPGGILAAILSEGGFCRQDKKSKGFREFIEDHGTATLMLPPDSFKASGTRVASRMVQVKKPR